MATRDLPYISKNDFQQLARLADQTAGIMGGLMKYLKESGNPGPKFLRKD